jgi:hypothetical protein
VIDTASLRAGGVFLSVHPTVLTNRDLSCKFTTFIVLMSIFLLIVSVTRHFLLAHAWVIRAARVQLLFI